MSQRPVFGTLGFYEAVAEDLNNDPVWLDMATPITYDMIYHYEEPIDKVFFIRFEAGKITETGELASADERPADFVIAAKPDAWKAVITQEMNPTAALASNRLKIKGKQTILLRHMKKFSYLINKMTQMDTVFE